ncbi:SH3 domain-containing protein [Hoeflea ulvae]|uniref:SH3 domain-containing protein n=1 Tax=Hoeflea ulvae TaxID=2983764 RepID=A0ABT3YB71_9HYPH|nr:SH3 domain-containing protein [Hoeflea ulvae]MCY0093124.1 SH3 domain-containing protein [Hoeflea ulvae]
MRRLSFITAVCLALTGLVASPMLDSTPGSAAFAQGAAKGPSGLPLPRFVSLKAKRVNLRIGPGRDYAVSWLYTKSGVPMEVIQEYDNWRRVRDAEGTEGWVYQSLLSGERTAVTAPWKKSEGEDSFINMHREARTNANIVARLEPGVMVEILACDGEWCEARADGTSGWVPQNEIWGAYPGEAFR